jgi:hypothetical protein
MPADGNAHPLPGHLVPDNNLFVMPEYPAMGWNDMPAPAQHHQPAAQQEPHDVQHEMPQDPVDAASGISSASPDNSNNAPVIMMNEPVEPPPEVLGQAEMLVQQFNEEAAPMNPVHVEAVPLVAVHEELQENLGNPVDVLMEFDLQEEQILPADVGVVAQENAALFQDNISDVAPSSSVAALHHPSPSIVVSQTSVLPQREDPVPAVDVVPGENLERAIILYNPPLSQQFEDIDLALSHIQATAADPVSKAAHSLVFPVTASAGEVLVTGEKVAAESVDDGTKRSWAQAFDGSLGFSPSDASASPIDRQAVVVTHSAPQDSPLVVSQVSAPVQFQAVAGSSQAKKTRQRKKKPVPLVDTSAKRCTRSSALKEGYRVPPIVDLAPKPRKRARKAVPAMRGPEPAQDQDSKANDSSSRFSVTPPIPVSTLQRIGDMLGIYAQLLTADKLTAKSGSDESKSG